MRYVTEYWHYQSPIRHYHNHWAMLIEKDYDAGRYPQIELTVTVFSEDIRNARHAATLYDMAYSKVESFAGAIEGVMKVHGLDFDQFEYEDLITLLIEIVESRKVGRIY